jgi:hypothetical protein
MFIAYAGSLAHDLAAIVNRIGPTVATARECPEVYVTCLVKKASMVNAGTVRSEAYNLSAVVDGIGPAITAPECSNVHIIALPCRVEKTGMWIVIGGTDIGPTYNLAAVVDGMGHAIKTTEGPEIFVVPAACAVKKTGGATPADTSIIGASITYNLAVVVDG